MAVFAVLIPLVLALFAAPAALLAGALKPAYAAPAVQFVLDGIEASLG